MIVKDLIKLLQDLDPEKEVRIRGNTFSTVEINTITLSGDTVVIDNWKALNRYKKPSQ